MCPELIQLPGRGTFHLISFFQKKNKQNGLHKDQIYEMKNALQACFIKLILLLIQHCHHCDHSEDFLWSCIAITAIILLISSCQRCDHSEDFLWCCIAVFWLRLAILVIIAKCSSVAASVFEYQEGCELSIPAELRKNLEQSWKVTKWSYLIFVSHPWPDLTCL